MRFLRPIALCAFLGGIVAACSSGGDGGAATQDAFITSFCDLVKPCCAQAKLRTDGAVCRSFASAVAGSGYDAAAGEACLNDMRAAQGSATFCSDFGNSPSCERVFPNSGGNTGGTKPPGATCSSDDECAPSSEGRVDCASSFGSGGAEVRKCQVLVAGKEGDTPCGATRDGNTTFYSSWDGDIPARAFICDVANGLRCDDKQVCSKIPAVGQPCSGFGSFSCVEGAYCSSGTCVARKNPGEACDFSSSECVETAYCDSTSKKCVAKLADGAACTRSEVCLSRSCVNGACDKRSSGDLGLLFLCGNP
jgi:hypothetical protein